MKKEIRGRMDIERKGIFFLQESTYFQANDQLSLQVTRTP
jgi:hypothetical protein